LWPKKKDGKEEVRCTKGVVQFPTEGRGVPQKRGPPRCEPRKRQIGVAASNRDVIPDRGVEKQKKNMGRGETSSPRSFGTDPQTNGGGEDGEPSGPEWGGNQGWEWNSHPNILF